MMTATTQLDAFRQEIEKAGLTPPANIIADGKLHRFASNGDRADDAGWYTYFPDETPAGVFGCWRKNVKQTWNSKADSTLTAAERERQRTRLDEARRQREEDERLRHAESATRAQTIWDQAASAPEDHPYLQKKHIQPHGLCVDDLNRLIVPVTIGGAISSLQFIDANGEKQFLPGGKVKGGSFTIGARSDTGPLLLCEGFATGASLHEATGSPVAIAFSAGNLLPVAQALRRQYPQAQIIVCGDRDHSGIGQAKAHEAADAVNGIVALPEGDGMDWNDVHQQHGLEVVRQKVAVILAPSPVRAYTPSAGVAQVHTPPELAREPNILARFEHAMRACGVVGEERCAKLVFLAVTSRILDEPISLAIKGLTSSGKSFTTETTLKFFPGRACITMTAMSERALIYMKEDFAHKTLVLFEASALREQKEKTEGNMTAYFLRSLLSEGRISYPVTVRDKNEGFVTKTIVKKGPTNVILTTTATVLHGENETRMLSIPTNDTNGQTRAIMQRLAGGPVQAPDFTAWHALQDWLEQAEHRVVIPYASYLAEQIPPVAVRLRRDFRSLLRLIETHAILHQSARAKDDDGCIVANTDDYLAIRALIADLLAAGVGATVSDVMRETVLAVKNLASEDGVTVQKLADHLKLDRSAVQRRVHAAREKGFLINQEEKRGRPGRYMPGEPLPEQQELLPVTLLGPGCAHSSLDPTGSVHSVSDSEPKAVEEGVQMCSHNGEKYATESEEVIDLVD